MYKGIGVYYQHTEVDHPWENGAFTEHPVSFDWPLKGFELLGIWPLSLLILV